MREATEAVIDNFIKSLQEHPSVTAFVFVMFFSMASYSVYTFAEKTELETHIEKTAKQFESFEERINALEFGIASRALETEIFELQRIIESGQGREVDRKRLNKLQYRLKHLERNRNGA